MRVPTRFLSALALAFLTLICGCQRKSLSHELLVASPQTSQPASENRSVPSKQLPDAAASSIGVATMEADGTISLRLMATAPGGTSGEALIRYPRQHKEYARVLAHLPGIKPGDTKPVPPFPD